LHLVGFLLTFGTLFKILYLVHQKQSSSITHLPMTFFPKKMYVSFSSPLTLCYSIAVNVKVQAKMQVALFTFGFDNKESWLRPHALHACLTQTHYFIKPAIGGSCMTFFTFNDARKGTLPFKIKFIKAQLPHSG